MTWRLEGFIEESRKNDRAACGLLEIIANNANLLCNEVGGGRHLHVPRHTQSGLRGDVARARACSTLHVAHFARDLDVDEGLHLARLGPSAITTT
jgi:hypothetical protein